MPKNLWLHQKMAMEHLHHHPMLEDHQVTGRGKPSGRPEPELGNQVQNIQSDLGGLKSLMMEIATNLKSKNEVNQADADVEEEKQQ